jgi:hypothetical protein
MSATRCSRCHGLGSYKSPRYDAPAEWMRRSSNTAVAFDLFSEVDIPCPCTYSPDDRTFLARLAILNAGAEGVESPLHAKRPYHPTASDQR